MLAVVFVVVGFVGSEKMGESEVEFGGVWSSLKGPSRDDLSRIS